MFGNVLHVCSCMITSRKGTLIGLIQRVLEFSRRLSFMYAALSWHWIQPSSHRKHSSRLYYMYMDYMKSTSIWSGSKWLIMYPESALSVVQIPEISADLSLFYYEYVLWELQNDYTYTFKTPLSQEEMIHVLYRCCQTNRIHSYRHVAKETRMSRSPATSWLVL